MITLDRGDYHFWAVKPHEASAKQAYSLRRFRTKKCRTDFLSDNSTWMSTKANHRAVRSLSRIFRLKPIFTKILPWPITVQMRAGLSPT